jgi:DNA-binding transcriptional ArsR family regulator/protein-L-isoaspartate O-methyltransferase
MTQSLDASSELFQLFAEPTRVRLMALLAKDELTVAELVSITELGQSNVSTHLGRLREAGLLRDRKAGSSTFYALNDGAMPEAARKVWALVEAGTRDARLDADRDRCEKVVRSRARAAGWPDAVAGEMERHYSPGRTWEATARAFLGLMRLGDVLDAGSGDGTIAQLIAPRARSVTCVDRNERMIEAARQRLARQKNVSCRLADVHELPFKDASFDEVLLFNVLTDTHTPGRVVAEAARVLRRGGALVVVTLDEHSHADVTSPYGHVHSGFSPEKVRRMLGKAGLAVDHSDVTSREKRQPNFEVVTAFARKA